MNGNRHHDLQAEMPSRREVDPRAASIIREGQRTAREAEQAWQNYAQGVAAGMGVQDGWQMKWEGERLFWVPDATRAMHVMEDAPRLDAVVEAVG